jgi:hypothetical protein
MLWRTCIRTMQIARASVKSKLPSLYYLIFLIDNQQVPNLLLLHSDILTYDFGTYPFFIQSSRLSRSLLPCI